MKNILLLALLVLMMGCGKENKGQTLPSEENSGVSVDPVRPRPPVRPRLVSPWEKEYMELLNEHRMRMGLKKLKSSKMLVGVALDHSVNMAQNWVRFGHHGSGQRCDKLHQTYTKSNLCGENVAFGQRTPKAVFEAWLHSPGHREIIEEARYTHTGLGFAKNQYGVVYWTQVFLEVN